MKEGEKRIIFHIDVNNAFLSWTAVKMLKDGEKLDIRKIPSVIGGEEKERHGIVLAKSMPAKKRGVQTAETLYSARQKCPNLKVFKPDYSWYYEQSNLMYQYLTRYTPLIERYSIDECFLDLSGTSLLYKNYETLAEKIKNDIKTNFGFTVNVGIGNNKLCAKMASDFEKPDKVHTLYNEEIMKKMWPLPVGDLFMVGKSTAAKLRELGIETIKDLAICKPEKIQRYFKNQTSFLINSANGIDETKVTPRTNKSDSISISETLPYDCSDIEVIKDILFRQTEEVSRNLRNQKQYAKTIAITYKNNIFNSYQKQSKLPHPENLTVEIYKAIIDLLEKSWRNEPIRNIGMRLGDLTDNKNEQISLFSEPVIEDESDKMQEIVDDINNKYGGNVIIPASIKLIGKKNSRKKLY
ncbi:MAG: DNA polymerase IV [Clostridium sp.]|jgi:DNA polymerase IV|nr:DNA polymerase IV [Clostridium sp.]